MIWFYIILFVIQIFGYTIIGFNLLISAISKNKVKLKKNIKWLIVLLIFSGLFFEKLPGSRRFWWPIETIESLYHNKKLVGVSYIDSKPIYELHSERGFNGDGQSISIYSLNEEVTRQFLTPDTSFLNAYPKASLRKDWKVQTWNETPIKEEHTNVFDFAKRAENHSKYALEEILREKGNYYAFFYLKTRYIGNVDFYIISPKNGILIAINVNT